MVAVCRAWRWVYSDGIARFQERIYSIADMDYPYSQDVEVAFVFGDTILMEGQYACIDGINFGVYVLWRWILLLKLRQEAMMDGGGDTSHTRLVVQMAQEQMDQPAIDGGAFTITSQLTNKQPVYLHI